MERDRGVDRERERETDRGIERRVDDRERIEKGKRGEGKMKEQRERQR